MTTAVPERTGLHLADGAILLGEYKNSGLKDPPFIIRRDDGHMLYVSRLIYLVAWAMSRHDHPDEIADLVSEVYGQDVSADNVLYLAEKKLAPLGLIASDDRTAAPPVTADPLLALRLRLPLVPERMHRWLSAGLTPLFWPPFIVAALLGLVVTDVWLFTSQAAGIYEGMQMMVFEPRLLLIITLLTLTAGLFHELGHAAATRYGGAVPGAMGAGVYIVWPVFYTDVSDTYRLDRRGRLRTDLGGLYFNVISVLTAVAAYGFTGYSPLLVLTVLIQLESLRQFLPFIRLDGYYVMSDLAGVPNLFSYMSPVLTFLVRRRDPEARAEAERKLSELTRRARVLITGWVVVTAPVIAVNVVVFAVLLPRLAGLAWGSATYQIAGMTTVSGAITPVGVANGLINLLLLGLPVAGITYLLGMMLQRGLRLAARWWPRRPAITGAATALATVALLAQVTIAWPGSFAGARERARLDTEDEESDRFELALSDLSPGQLPLTPEASAVNADPSDQLLPPDDKEDAELDLAAPPPPPTSEPSTGTTASDPTPQEPGSSPSPEESADGSDTARSRERGASSTGPISTRSDTSDTASESPSADSSTSDPDDASEPEGEGADPGTEAPSEDDADEDDADEDDGEPEEEEESGLQRLTEAFFGFVTGD